MHEAWLPSEHSLYRPRHGGQRVALVCAAIFFCIPLLATVVGIGPGIDENRAPRAFPGFGDGWGVLTGLSGWASDALPFRGAAIHAEDGISRDVFGEPPQFGAPQETTGPIVQQPVNPSPDSTSNQAQPTGSIPAVMEGKDGWLYYGVDISSKCTPVTPLNTTFANMARLRSVVEQSGRKFVLVVAPDKTTMVPEHLPDKYPGKACAAERSAEFWRRAPVELGALDMREPLRQTAAKVNGPVYFPQDTHWTFAAGLTMTRRIAEQMKPGVTGNWKTQATVEWSSSADLPKIIGKSGTNTTTEFSLAPDGGEDRSNWTERDFHHTLKFDTSPMRGTVNTPTAMIADSFTQLASGYFAAAFSHVSITHVAALQQDPAGIAKTLADANTVVFEVVERDLARGDSVVSNPQVIDAIGQALLARPIK